LSACSVARTDDGALFAGRWLQLKLVECLFLGCGALGLPTCCFIGGIRKLFFCNSLRHSANHASIGDETKQQDQRTEDRHHPEKNKICVDDVGLIERSDRLPNPEDILPNYKSDQSKTYRVQDYDNHANCWESRVVCPEKNAENVGHLLPFYFADHRMYHYAEFDYVSRMRVIILACFERVFGLKV